MAQKKYWWLKLPNDFFTQIPIKKLRKIAGGDTYTLIYLKMLLKSLDKQGYLEYECTEDEFIADLALDIDEDKENVKVTVSFLIRNKLLVLIDGSDERQKAFLPETAKAIMSESSSAERVRRHREKQKALQCNADVTLQVLHRNVDIDTDIDLKLNHPSEVGSTYKVSKPVDNFGLPENLRNSAVDYVDCVDNCGKPEKLLSLPDAGSVDNFGLSVSEGFAEFLKIYPRSQHDTDKVRTAFRQLVAQHVAISDLLAAALTYAKKVKQEKINPQFIKMPVNFLQEKIWLKFRPTYQLDCPICHGKGIVSIPASSGRADVSASSCSCADRYKALDPDVMPDILAMLTRRDGDRQNDTAVDARKGG